MKSFNKAFSKKRVIIILSGLFLLSVFILELLSKRECASIYNNFKNPCPDLLIENIFNVTGELPLAYPPKRTLKYSDINKSDFLKNVEKRTIYAPQEKVKANGIACFNYAFVADELPEKAKRYVAIHENIHLEGEYNEARTNYLAARMEPLGFIQTVFYSIWLSVKKMTIQKFPCQVGQLWNIFKLYFLQLR